MSSKDFIKRPAIDTFHHSIGSYYDIRRDHFLHCSCLKTAVVLNDDIVEKRPCSTTRYEHSFYDSMCETFGKLNIDSSLSVSLLAGLAKPEASFKFLMQSPSTSQTVKESIFYLETVRYERLKETVLNNEEQLKALISFDKQPCEATHIVVGIVYGFCVNANFEKHVEKHEKKYEVESKLKLMLTEVKAVSSGSVHVNTEHHQTSSVTTNSFNVKIYNNFNFADKLPQTAEETLTFFKQLPEYTKKDVSSATQIEYLLYPINHLKSLLSVASNNLNHGDISEATLCKIQSNADYLFEKQQKYNDYHELYDQVSACISESACKEIKKREDQLMITNLMYRKKLGENLVKVRSCSMNENEFLVQTEISFNELVQMYEQSYFQKEKIDFLHFASDQGCLLIDKCTTADLIPCKYGQKDKDLFVGVINVYSITTDDASWKLFIKRFTDIMNLKGKQAAYILRNDDVDLTESSLISSMNFRIIHYYDKRLIKNEIIDIKDSICGKTWYCDRCGTKDNEERLLAVKCQASEPPNWNNDDKNRLMDYGKCIICEKKDRFGLASTSSDPMYTVFYGITRLQYSTGVHRIEFQILSCEKRELLVSMKMVLYDNDITRVKVKFGTPFLSNENSSHENDIFELIIDCDTLKIELTNRKTKQKQAIGVDTAKFPLPWGCLFRHGDHYFFCPKVKIRLNEVTHQGLW